MDSQLAVKLTPQILHLPTRIPILKNWKILMAALGVVIVYPGVCADAPRNSRAEVAAALQGMGDAAMM